VKLGKLIAWSSGLPIVISFQQSQTALSARFRLFFGVISLLPLLAIATLHSPEEEPWTRAVPENGRQGSSPSPARADSSTLRLEKTGLTTAALTTRNKLTHKGEKST